MAIPQRAAQFVLGLCRDGLLGAVLVTCGIPAQEASGVLTLEGQAKQAIATGDTDAAVEAYLALAAAEPQQTKWVRGAVEALARGGRYNDALDLLEASCKRLPEALDLRVEQAKVTMLKAEGLAAGGRRDSYVLFAYEDAARLAGEVLAKDADNRDARLILAEARYAVGNLDDALNEGRDAARRFPDHPGGHIMVAKVLFQRFVASKQRLAGERPEGKAYEELATAAAEARRGATAALESAIAADPSRAFPHKLLGDVHAWNGNVAQALACYGRALALDPNTPVDHGWLATNAGPEELTKLYRHAFEAYHARPDADPRHGALLAWYLGKALFEQKRFADARTLMLASIRANPTYTNSLYYVWLASYWLGDHAAAGREAAAYAQQAPAAFADLLRSLPDRAQTLEILGFLAANSFAQKRIGESCALNHVLALVENSAETWNNYAFLCRETGQFEESLAAYERALEMEPESPQLLNDTAVILHYHMTSPANRARAKDMYERAVQLAQKQLADAGLDATERARITQALADAQSNLKKMAEGG
ncbi:MAG: tetratricopeptide repeat protein [Planctomycetota bacterium]